MFYLSNLSRFNFIFYTVYIVERFHPVPYKYKLNFLISSKQSSKNNVFELLGIS